MNIENDKIGYTAKWIECGVVSQREIQADNEVYDSANGDKNTEHYRYLRLSQYLNGLGQIGRKEIDGILEIASDDNDKSMAQSIVIELLNNGNINERDYTYLVSHYIVRSFNVSKIVKRNEILRSLRNNCGQEEIEKAISSGDSTVQEYLIEKCLLSEAQMAKIVKMGSNSGIRNRANAMLCKIKGMPNKAVQTEPVT